MGQSTSGLGFLFLLISEAFAFANAFEPSGGERLGKGAVHLVGCEF